MKDEGQRMKDEGRQLRIRRSSFALRLGLEIASQLISNLQSHYCVVQPRSIVQAAPVTELAASEQR
jgi:hypothetical protein